MTNKKFEPTEAGHPFKSSAFWMGLTFGIGIGASVCSTFITPETHHHNMPALIGSMFLLAATIFAVSFQRRNALKESSVNNAQDKDAS